MRPDIRDRGRKHIGALLLDQAGFLALRFGLLVDFFSLLLFFNLSFNHAPANDHAQAVNGGIFRQGKDVNAFDPRIRCVLKTLRNFGANNGAGNIHIDIGGDHWRLYIFSGLSGFKHQAAGVSIIDTDLAHISRARYTWLRRRCIRIGGRERACQNCCRCK